MASSRLHPLGATSSAGGYTVAQVSDWELVLAAFLTFLCGMIIGLMLGHELK